MLELKANGKQEKDPITPTENNANAIALQNLFNPSGVIVSSPYDACHLNRLTLNCDVKDYEL